MKIIDKNGKPGSGFAWIVHVGNRHLRGVQAMGAVVVAGHDRAVLALQHFLANGRAAIQAIFSCPFHALEVTVEVMRLRGLEHVLQRLLGTLLGMALSVGLADVRPAPTQHRGSMANAGFMTQPHLCPVLRNLHGIQYSQPLLPGFDLLQGRQAPAGAGPWSQVVGDVMQGPGPIADAGAAGQQQAETAEVQPGWASTQDGMGANGR